MISSRPSNINTRSAISIIAFLMFFSLAFSACHSGDHDHSHGHDHEEDESETLDLVGKGSKKKARAAASAVERAHENMKRQFEGMDE